MSFLDTFSKIYNGICTIDAFRSADKTGKIGMGINAASQFIQNNQDKIVKTVKNYKYGK